MNGCLIRSVPAITPLLTGSSPKDEEYSMLCGILTLLIYFLGHPFFSCFFLTLAFVLKYPPALLELSFFFIHFLPLGREKANMACVKVPTSV